MTIADYVLNHPWLVAVIENEHVVPWLPVLQVAWLLVTAPLVMVQVALHGKLSPLRA